MVNVIDPDLALAIAHPGIVTTGLVLPIIVMTAINIAIIVTMTKTMKTPVMDGAVVLNPDIKTFVVTPHHDPIVSHRGTTMHEDLHAHVETRILTIILLIVRTGSTSVLGYPVVVPAPLIIGNTKITDGHAAVPGMPMLVEVLETGRGPRPSLGPTRVTLLRISKLHHQLWLCPAILMNLEKFSSKPITRNSLKTRCKHPCYSSDLPRFSFPVSMSIIHLP